MKTNFDISKLTSFKIGGEIARVYFPQSVSEFCEIMQKEPDAKVFGNLSNTLVSSYGYDGAIVITTEITKNYIDDNKFVVGCGISGPLAAQIAQSEGLSGFEFMIGFPGSIGGNVCMNASANGQCISDTFVSAICYVDGEIKTLSKEDMEFSYRTSICQKKNVIVLEAEFELIPDDKDKISEKMRDNLQFRRQHQPSLALPNCGSVFRNPEGDSAGRLLDSVGAKQMSVGGARVWENHANFIINDKTATSMDVLKLMDKMSSAVFEKYGVKLKPEVRFLGGCNNEEVELWQKIK